MSSGLLEQLEVYFQQVDGAQSAVTEEQVWALGGSQGPRRRAVMPLVGAAVAVAVALAVLIVGLIPLLLQESETPPADTANPTPSTLGTDTTAPGETVTTLAAVSRVLTIDQVDFAGGPLVETANHLWVASFSPHAVRQLDKTSLEVIREIPLDGFSQLLSDGDTVWAIQSDPSLIIELDANTGQVTDTIDVPSPGTEELRGMLAFDAIWLIVEPATLIRFDIETGQLTSYGGNQFDLNGWWLWAGAVDRTLWAWSPQGFLASFSIDSETFELFDMDFDGTPPNWPLLTPEAIWFGGYDTATLNRFDLTEQKVTDRLPGIGWGLFGEGPPLGTSSALVDGAMWWSYPSEHGLTRTDLETLEVTDLVDLDGFPGQIVLSNDGSILWVARAGRILELGLDNGIGRMEPGRFAVVAVDVATREIVQTSSLEQRVEYLLPHFGGVWVLLIDGTVTSLDQP